MPKDSAPIPPASARRHLVWVWLLCMLPPVLGSPALPWLVAHRPWFWLVAFVFGAALPAFLLDYALKSGLVSREDLGLHGRIRGQAVPWALARRVAGTALLLLPAWALLLAPAVLLLPLGPGFFRWSEVVPSWEAPLARITVAVYVAAAAGFFEELVYRGLARRVFGGGWRYVLLSAAVFGLAHWQQGSASVVGTFLFGLIAAALYLRWRNLWPLIAGHTTTDLVLFLAGE